MPSARATAAGRLSESAAGLQRILARVRSTVRYICCCQPMSYSYEHNVLLCISCHDTSVDGKELWVWNTQEFCGAVFIENWCNQRKHVFFFHRQGYRVVTRPNRKHRKLLQKQLHCGLGHRKDGTSCLRISRYTPLVHDSWSCWHVLSCLDCRDSSACLQCCVCRAPFLSPLFFVLDQTNYGWSQDEVQDGRSSETSLVMFAIDVLRGNGH